MKERKLYSLTGKLIVFLLLIVFAASALFGGIQTLMLSSVGLTPNAAAKKYAFEETTACGTLVQRQLHNVMSYYNDMSKFGTNVDTTEQKRIDYRAFATDGEGSGGISTTYTIDQLVKMYDDGSSADSMRWQRILRTIMRRTMPELTKKPILHTKMELT